MSTRRALVNAAVVMMSRGRRSFAQQLHDLHAGLLGQAACARRRRPGSVPLPGRPMPMASVRQFIELAVNMPEQEPQPGQAVSS